MSNRPLTLRDLGKSGRSVADWLAANGYNAGPVHKKRHWRFEVSKAGVTRMATLACTPRNDDASASRCIRQIVHAFDRTFSDAV